MLNQLAGRRKFFGAIIILSVSSLLGEHVFADALTDIIALLSDRDKSPVRGDIADVGVYLIYADGFNPLGTYEIGVATTI